MYLSAEHARLELDPRRVPKRQRIAFVDSDSTCNLEMQKKKLNYVLQNESQAKNGL